MNADSKKRSHAPTLAELQKTLALVVNGSAKADDHSLAQSWIDLAGQTISAKERLDVYADAWFMRLEESLAEDFPKVRARFEAGEWEALVKDYFAQFPSQSFTLARAGDAFPAFLSEKCQVPRWLADIALFEKALYKALSARDVDVWNVAELQTFGEEKLEALSFELQPSVTLIESKWNVFDPDVEFGSNPDSIESFVVVYRDGFTPTSRSLAADEFEFLKQVANKATLGELAGEFQETNWLEWLSEAASEGLIHPRFK